MKSYEILTNLDAVQSLADGIAEWAITKGFWNREADFPEVLVKSQKIALMHSELSELLEELRKPEPRHLNDCTNEEEELADLIIRALDYAGHYKLRIGAAIGAKMAKNEGRPYMHGKQF